MKANRPEGGLLKQYLDKILLLLGLAGLCASALLAWVLHTDAGGRLGATGPKKLGAPPAAASMVASNLDAKLGELLDKPMPPAQRLMVTQPERVSCVKCFRPISRNEGICPFCNEPQPESGLVGKDTDQDHDSIPDAQELAMGLNPRDPADAQADADGDGFSNLEEYRAGTSHTKAGSHPPRYTRLRLERLEQDKFFLKFKGITKGADGADVFQIVERGSNRDHFKRIGEGIVGGWSVKSYDPKDAEGETLIVLRAMTNIVVAPAPAARAADKGSVSTNVVVTNAIRRLVKGKEIDDDSKTAILRNTQDPSERGRMIVKRGVPFQIDDVKCEVVEMTPDFISIRPEGGGTNVWKIGRMQLGEGAPATGIP